MRAGYGRTDRLADAASVGFNAARAPSCSASAATTPAGSLGHQITGASLDYFADIDQNDISLFLGYILGVIGFLTGLGFVDYPLARLRGYPPSLRAKEPSGIGRYFGLCTDHKVVGIQYLWGIGFFFFIGGLNAMLIRFELLPPTSQVFPAGQYLTLVGLHGTMMMGIMSSAILGPFANYFVPIMIGARRMAFPRIEALTFWLLMLAGAILDDDDLLRRLPDRLDGLRAARATRRTRGSTAYIVFFALVGISMRLLGLNMIATIVTMRAPGLTWSRLPIFVWGVVSTAALMVLAAPVLVAALGDGADGPDGADDLLHREQAAAAQYLYENLFWVFGHPEVYILALPGFGIVLEILPVFARKPLWGYRLAVAGLLGRDAALAASSGSTTCSSAASTATCGRSTCSRRELISLPTGFTFLCAMMTLWRGQIRFTVPMLFCLAWFFNFLIGGLSGRVPLGRAERRRRRTGASSRWPTSTTRSWAGSSSRSSPAIYYWVPKMTGYR